ncbi:aminopeptidase, partial [candidate division WOR-3 bacterium]|nr:aminopeptidase [candidate division WOR-3 bacterium]
GSSGDTGADSSIIEDAVLGILKQWGKSVSYSMIRETMRKSFCISADVACALDPDYPEVVEKNNTAKLGHGVCIVKYTGSRGKSGTNDAHAESFSRLRTLFNSNKVVWQVGELGKVDEGGGGTVAKFISYWGIPTIDCGTPILSMHSPFEVSHKADLFQTVKAFKSFYLS